MARRPRSSRARRRTGAVGVAGWSAVGALLVTPLASARPQAHTSGAGAALRPRTEDARLRAVDTRADDSFARNVALHGSTVVVGAMSDDDVGPDSGSAYVFERVGARWVEAAKLTTADGFDDDAFGEATAIWGETIAVGAPRRSCGASHGHPTECGAVYFFERDAFGALNEAAKLVASDGAFGSSVSLHGERALVGARHSDAVAVDGGAAYLFEDRPGLGWVLDAKVVASDTLPARLFGHSVSLGADFAALGVGANAVAPAGYVVDR